VIIWRRLYPLLPFILYLTSHAIDNLGIMQPENLDIMIVAGEASGDLHGANLVRAMHDINPDLYFYGVGGERMKEAGVSLTVHSSEMAVMGVTEVLPRLGFILKVKRELKKSLRQSRPALLILIDYPGFNLPLAKFAKEDGIKVFYYISPKVWAWKKKRIYALERYVDRMALILPFEKQVYEGVNLDARFVGNPLLDTVRRKYTREASSSISTSVPKRSTASFPASDLSFPIMTGTPFRLSAISTGSSPTSSVPISML